MITNVEIEDFIGIFDTDVDVSVFREYYDWMEHNNMAFNRRDSDIRVDAVTGMSFFLTIKDGLPMEYSKEFNETIGEALEIYEQEYNALKGFEFQQHYVNIQKLFLDRDIINGIVKIKVMVIQEEFLQPCCI